MTIKTVKCGFIVPCAVPTGAAKTYSFRGANHLMRQRPVGYDGEAAIYK
jgi:hypothetical protein